MTPHIFHQQKLPESGLPNPACPNKASITSTMVEIFTVYSFKSTYNLPEWKTSKIIFKMA
jgi:hypothetical protein